MNSVRKDIRLLPPDVERDYRFALSWFNGPQGITTLLSMGNAEHEIIASTPESEKKTLQQFIYLEKKNKQITRMIIVDGKTIGAVWIELFENHNVKSPSVHMMIGDTDYRGKGIGRFVISEMIKYIKEKLKSNVVYSRHLVSNKPAMALLDSLGFIDDGKSYIDSNNLEWQNIKLVFSI